MSYCPFCDKHVEKGKLREHCDTQEHARNTEGSGNERSVWDPHRTGGPKVGKSARKPSLDEQERRIL